MPGTNGNTVLYATKTQSYPVGIVAANTAVNTYTKVLDAPANGCVITDILFRNQNAAAYNFDIIICPTGSHTSPEFARAQVQINASAGNNANSSVSSVAASQPLLFDLDLAGNRCLTLESGMSLYVKNGALIGANPIYVTAKERDY